MKSPKEKKNKKEKKVIVKKERQPNYTTGRPTDYNKKIANEICQIVSQSEIGLRKLCAKYDHWPDAVTIIRWRISIPEFCNQYDSAKKCQVELLVDDILDISKDKSMDILSGAVGQDTGNSTAVSRDKLITDNIKWLSGKVAPKIYGETKKEIIYEKQNLANMDLDDRISQIESLSLEEQRELFGIVAKKIKESKTK